MKPIYLFNIFLIGFFTTICAAELRNTSCVEKEKALAYLEMAENLLTKARASVPSCNEDVNSTVDSECGGKHIAQIEFSKKLISDVRRNFPKCPKSIEKEKPRECAEVLASGLKENGVYTVWPSEHFKPRISLQVYCDMETDHGGWTVIQRRGKFPIQQDFYQDWETYKNGFGNLTEEFWLGNENIRVLCHYGCEIRFDLQDTQGKKYFALYQNFHLRGRNYTLRFSDYTGNAENGLELHQYKDFSTKDHGRAEIVDSYRGGWWFRESEQRCNLNGMRQPKRSLSWHFRVIQSVEIKVRTMKT